MRFIGKNLKLLGKTLMDLQAWLNLRWENCFSIFEHKLSSFLGSCRTYLWVTV